MKKLIAILIGCFLLTAGNANNVVISNVSIVNGGPNNIYVQFNLSWENSWRVTTGQANYDGVWVFFKYHTTDGRWLHLELNSNAAADLLPAGIGYWRPTNMAPGAVIHRSASNIGVGAVNATGIRLSVMNYIDYDIELRSFAIEMVNIPAASELFFGDGNGTNESIWSFHLASSDNSFTVNNFLTSVDASSSDDVEVRSPGSFTVNGGSGDGISSLPVNNFLFPTSSEIWCMKYEITQGAYRDFLNTLSVPQQITRTTNAPTSATGTGALTTSGSFRNYLEIRTPASGAIPAVYGCDASGNNVYDEAADGEFISCNFLSWNDLAAWLDWAGMAPMTEIQFERICRGYTSAGPVSPQYADFAWGTTTIFNNFYTMSSPFTASEVATNASTTVGNASYSQTVTAGPFRNGIFATPTSNRITSGAAFFGVMEMTGGVDEACVTVGNLAGRSFNKIGTSRGNGYVSLIGNADVPYWPGNVNTPNAETAAFGENIFYGYGTIARGGNFNSLVENLRVSNRYSSPISNLREFTKGGRGVIVIAMY
jgi:hypothetical protein